MMRPDWISNGPGRTLGEWREWFFEEERQERQWLLLAAAIVVAAVVATLVLRWIPSWLADTNGLDTADKVASERGRVRTALLAALAGILAAIGAVYTARTFALNRAGQITDRFGRAVDQLGSQKP